MLRLQPSYLSAEGDTLLPYYEHVATSTGLGTREAEEISSLTPSAASELHHLPCEGLRHYLPS